MRIALIEGLSGLGSMRRYAARLADSLPACGVEVARVPRRAQQLIPLAERGAVARVFFYLDKYLLLQLRALAARGTRAHVTDHGYGHLLFSLRPGRACVTVHDLAPFVSERWGQPVGRAAAAFRYSLRAMRRAGRLVTPTAAVREDILERTGFPPDRVVVVPNGVDAGWVRVSEGAERAEWRARFKIERGRRFLLHVGGTEPRKNVEGLIEVFARLDCPDERELWLVHAGAPFTRAQRARADALGVADRIVAHGACDDAELGALYSLAELLVFPSFYEGFGWPPLEAAACGTASVVGDTPAARETLGEAAALADPHAPDALSGAIRALLEDETDRRALAAKAEARAREFTWERTASALAKVYAEMEG